MSEILLKSLGWEDHEFRTIAQKKKKNKKRNGHQRISAHRQGLLPSAAMVGLEKTCEYQLSGAAGCHLIATLGRGPNPTVVLFLVL